MLSMVDVVWGMDIFSVWCMQTCVWLWVWGCGVCECRCGWVAGWEYVSVYVWVYLCECVGVRDGLVCVGVCV